MTIKTQAYLQGYMHEKTAFLPKGHDRDTGRIEQDLGTRYTKGKKGAPVFNSMARERVSAPSKSRNPKVRAYEDLLWAIKSGEYGPLPSTGGSLPGNKALSQLALKEGPVGEWNVKRTRKPIEQWAKENPHLTGQSQF